MIYLLNIQSELEKNEIENIIQYFNGFNKCNKLIPIKDTFDRSIKFEASKEYYEDGKGCETCVHCEDNIELCKLRECGHAFGKLIDCYERRE